MKKLFLILSIVIVSSLLISCGGSLPPNPTEQAASDQYSVESSNPKIVVEAPSPNYDTLETEVIYVDSLCSQTWAGGIDTDPKFVGMEYIVDPWVNIVRNEEHQAATIKWAVRLYSIAFNDRIVYPDSWTVVQKIPDPSSNDGFYLSIELNPDPWITAAKERAKLAPDLEITREAFWEYQKDYGYYGWTYMDYTCSEK